MYSVGAQGILMCFHALFFPLCVFFLFFLHLAFASSERHGPAQANKRTFERNHQLVSLCFSTAFAWRPMPRWSSRFYVLSVGCAFWAGHYPAKVYGCQNHFISSEPNCGMMEWRRKDEQFIKDCWMALL